MAHRFFVAIVVVFLTAGTTFASTEYSHQEYFEHYEGTKTCLECHEDEATSFFHSKHYQWKGPAPNAVASHGQELGKINMINDFCTNPQPNWIGKIVNDQGKVLELGCAKCHAGLGKKPSTEISREQLENIDCLICHASGYRRDLYTNEAGEWEFRPILWNNQEGMDSVSKRISSPQRTMCLRCHSGSGGGPNFKRGDLEYELAEPDYDFDVHMDIDGNDMQCTDCHSGEDHRIPGPGADIAGNDMPEKRVLCDNDACHGIAPHAKAMLNKHTQRVFCTACHIPTFAKADVTNMMRDWSKPRFVEDPGKWAFTGEVAKDVVPAYRWWNGKTTEMQLPGQPVALNEKGEVKVAVPVGSKEDPESRIFAFKEYHAMMPVLDEKNWLLPLETGHYFLTGDADGAGREATHKLYGIENAAFSWKRTVHYMGIFHEVAPSYSALRCLDCHGPDTRLDWTELGYEADPLAEIFKTTE